MGQQYSGIFARALPCQPHVSGSFEHTFSLDEKKAQYYCIVRLFFRKCPITPIAADRELHHKVCKYQLLGCPDDHCDRTPESFFTSKESLMRHINQRHSWRIHEGEFV